MERSEHPSPRELSRRPQSKTKEERQKHVASLRVTEPGGSAAAKRARARRGGYCAFAAEPMTKRKE
jgi:hypothetical protein